MRYPGGPGHSRRAARRPHSVTAGRGDRRADRTPVTMEHLQRAVNRELEKLGRPVAPGPKTAKEC